MTRCSGSSWNYTKCGVGSYYGYDKSSKPQMFSSVPMWPYFLPDGSVIAISMNGQCVQNMAMNNRGRGEVSSMTLFYGTYLHQCGTISIDINGRAKPNIANRDKFLFKIVTDGIIPAGSEKEVIGTETFKAQCNGMNNQGHSAAWVIKNKNMDYLRCPEKLGWNKARSCSK